MSSVNIEIKGLRPDIRLEEFDSGKNGWKELIANLKNNSDQDSRDIRSKYLSRPSEILPSVLKEDIRYRECAACHQPVLVSGIVEHLEKYCIEKMPINSSGDTPDVMSSPVKGKGNARRSSSIDPEGFDSPSKKQKTSTPSGSGSGSGSTRKQRKIKQRNPTEPHLVNFDKQCGVPLPEGGVCGRSLTCKSHSMGAKRAVEGRSQPFDILLADYQKRNQLKSSASKTRIQKAQQNQDPQTTSKQKGKEKSNSKTNNSNSNNNSSSNNTGNDTMSKISPEEETTLVLNGVSRSYPLPLESTVLTSTRTRTKYIRMREMFASAFNIKPGFKSPGVGAFRSRVGLIDIDRTTDYTFRIRTPQPMNAVPQKLTPEQLQALQAQRLKQQQQQQQQQLSPQQQQQQQLSPQQSSQQLSQQQQQQQRQQSPQQQQLLAQQQQRQRQANTTGSLSQMQVQMQQTGQSNKPGVQQSMMGQSITPRDIQTQQLIMQQQQQKLLQKKRMEDASAQLDTASKLMQHSIGSPVNVQVRNNSNQQGVQFGANNGFGGRVN